MSSTESRWLACPKRMVKEEDLVVISGYTNEIHPFFASVGWGVASTETAVKEKRKCWQRDYHDGTAIGFVGCEMFGFKLEEIVWWCRKLYKIN